MTLQELTEIPATIEKVLLTETNADLITPEIQTRYCTERLAQPDIVVELTNLALQNAGEDLYDPSTLSAVRVNVMGVISYALEVGRQNAEIRRNHLANMIDSKIARAEKAPYLAWRS